MRRRDFIKIVAGSAIAWPLAARAQRPAMPVIGFIRDGSARSEARWVDGFQKGLGGAATGWPLAARAVARAA
jgi:putative ABC transport system substrate-binding protein